MQRPASLTFRLTLMFSAVASVVFLAFGWIIGQSLDDHFVMEDYKELEVIATAVNQSLSDYQATEDITQVKQRFDDMLVGHHGAVLRVTNAAEELIYNSQETDLSTVPRIPTEKLTKNKMQHWKNGEHNYRILRNKIKTKDNKLYEVIIGVVTDFHLHFLQSFRYTLWLMVVSGIVMMGLMGWIAVRHGHRPLHHMVDQISQIKTDELNTRLTPESVPSELTELAISFNDLLQRMEEAFARLSNFSDDIAHELRTPITNLMTQTQVALSKARSAEEYEEILYSNAEEYDRMSQMIGDMLFLAKADNGLHPPNSENINLVKEIHNLFDYYEAWAEELGISLTLTGYANTKADRLMLRRALSNLLSNAIRHTPVDETVSVNLETVNNSVIITVQNPGVAIQPEHLPKVFDRFYRIDPSRQRGSEGAGLGLAIVKSIVEAHHGKIEVTSDELYTQFRIELPN